MSLIPGQSMSGGARSLLRTAVGVSRPAAPLLRHACHFPVGIDLTQSSTFPGLVAHAGSLPKGDAEELNNIRIARIQLDSFTSPLLPYFLMVPKTLLRSDGFKRRTPDRITAEQSNQSNTTPNIGVRIQAPKSSVNAPRDTAVRRSSPTIVFGGERAPPLIDSPATEDIPHKYLSHRHINSVPTRHDTRINGSHPYIFLAEAKLSGLFLHPAGPNKVVSKLLNLLNPSPLAWDEVANLNQEKGAVIGRDLCGGARQLQAAGSQIV
ncbi:hypothetical protein DFH06DRAFT_1145444 [Mycena polygramma]|nr:hypothetical protein DFH06DRAFT_1145444 [Mycena polygramma]